MTSAPTDTRSWAVSRWFCLQHRNSGVAWFCARYQATPRDAGSIYWVIIFNTIQIVWCTKLNQVEIKSILQERHTIYMSRVEENQVRKRVANITLLYPEESVSDTSHTAHRTLDYTMPAHRRTLLPCCCIRRLPWHSKGVAQWPSAHPLMLCV